MAISLTLGFTGSDDKKLSITYPHADVDATGTQVKSLMQSIVANGDIFSEPPLAIVDAKFVDRTVTPVSLD